ncbi:uncharacterized protein [Ptychodera flava]|uniref:uncharacterized protein n=1 Tax=Ptychodera flava TaxID=63121 RepID=UPI00396A026C
MVVKFAIISGFLFGLIKVGAYPRHASCKVDWTFELPCQEVHDRIVSQMQKWKGPENCESGGEKCLYELTSSDGGAITGKHTTPVNKYVDSLRFILDESDGLCKVKGTSSSDLDYAYLDYSTNYCNLHNLIEGAQLHTEKGYSETTDNDVCTQYSSANCEVY